MVGKSMRGISEDVKMTLIFLIMIVVVVIVFSQMHEGFFTARNFTMLLKHASVNAMAALGLAFVIVSGHYDLSFPWVACFSGMTTSFLISKGIEVVPSVLAGVVSGLIWGFINGVAVSKLKLPDIITTIGTGSIAYGMSYLYSEGSYISYNFMMSGILELNDAKLLGIPLPGILMIILFFVGYMTLHRSGHGRRFYATGDNKVASVFSGININAYISFAFIICGGTASLATIITIASQGYGSVKTGIPLLLPSYAIVYLGAAMFQRPTIIGVFLSAIFISMILNGFTLLNVPFYSTNLIISVIVVAALGLSSGLMYIRRTEKGDSSSQVLNHEVNN